MIRMSERAYAEASFLDERLLAAGAEESWVGLAALETAAREISGESDFIFHIGHCGSTLLARLLGNDARLLALREPALLRVLAVQSEVGWLRGHLETFLKLYSRVWRPGQRSLVKATSFVSDIGPDILRRFRTARAILVAVDAPVYLATILSGDATRAELPRITPWRLRRLSKAVPTQVVPAPRSDGEMAAAGWACEMNALRAIANDFPDRIFWLDFDRFLGDLPAGLAASFAHLDVAVTSEQLVRLGKSPDLARYSKAPEHPFDAASRRMIIAEGFQIHRKEIQQGMMWLRTFAGALPSAGLLETPRTISTAPGDERC